VRVIDPSLEAELARYRGKWVAIDEIHAKVVAVEDSAASAYEKARLQHVTDPLIFKVPLGPERVHTT
jgi:Family of unknown function (DUF5678)